MTCPPWKGGTHTETKGFGGQGHHEWAQKALELAGSPYDPATEVPCISMERRDHEKTLSWGNYNSAKFYRDFQADLFRRDMYTTAFYVDARDVLHTHKDKYVEHLAQAEKVMLDLHEKARLQLSQELKKELEDRQKLVKEKQLLEIAVAEKALAELKQKQTLLKEDLEKEKQYKATIEERQKELLRSGLSDSAVRQEVNRLSDNKNLTQLEQEKVAKTESLQQSLEERVRVECDRVRVELEQRLQAEIRDKQYNLSLEQAKRIDETYRLGMHL